MIRSALNLLMALLLIGAAAYSWRLYSDYRADAAADAAADGARARKPGTDGGLMDFSGLQGENPDVIAWLAVPGTAIDYPVLQAGDNDYYLRRGLQGNANKNGALFLDCRVPADFSGFSSVIYGHHMKSGRMFQNLVLFKDKAFFDSHASCTLYTPGKTYRLEIFAVAVVGQSSSCYEFAFASPGERQAHLREIKNSAMHHRDIAVTADDRLVLLSTCSYEYTGARTVVAARLAG